MQRRFLIIGSILAAISVAIGAFGAHGLEKFLEETGRHDVFETAIKYQFYHTFALLFVALIVDKAHPKFLKYAGYSFLIGILLFSGSLYGIIAFQNPGLGIITPFGGLFFIVGWLMLATAAIKK